MNLYKTLISNNSILNDLIEQRCSFLNRISNYDVARCLKVGNDYYNDVRIFGYNGEINDINYTAVLYIRNIIISIHKVMLGNPIISFGFSGCSLETFTFNNELYAAHVPPSKQEDWGNIVEKHNIQRGIVFKPVVENNDIKLGGKYPSNRCWGIIDQNNEKYSLAVYENINYDYNEKTRKYEYTWAGKSYVTGLRKMMLRKMTE